MTWAPLLDDELADSAIAAVRELAPVAAQASACDRTIFWAYVSDHLDEPVAFEAYDVALGDLVRELHGGAASPALHGGLAGIGWTLAHVLDSDADDLLAAIDGALLDVLAAPWPGDHDLIEGLAGIGVYFLERGEAPTARAGLARVVELLDRAATTTDEGTTWHTAAALLSDREAWPAGHFDCGVAHGTPGVAAFLARAASVSDAPPRARALRDDAVRWILAQRAGGFPTRLSHTRPRDRARAAWCYGEPGIAAALWNTSEADAHAIARDAVQRDPATCGVRDPFLCHGAAGLGHLYNRMFQASGDRELAAAARAWFARTLAMRPFAPVAAVLDGALGVGLALVGAIATTEPRWDRLLLCDVAPRGE